MGSETPRSLRRAYVEWVEEQIEEFKERMGWTVPWYTVVGDEFQKARGTTEYFSLDVYLRDGDRVFL
ncbi:MAG TPA: DUF899 family protein, partial [Longimicrobium sp.]|nr:DUF899 family protein [Longimicrobium sp.]